MTGVLSAMTTALVAQAAPASTTAGCVVAPTGVQGICTQPGVLHIPVEYHTILPEIVLVAGALVILAVSSLLPKRSRPGLWVTLTVLVAGASLAASVWLWNDIDPKRPSLAVGNAIAVDRYSVFFMILVGSAIVLGAFIADGYLQREGLDGPELYVLALLCGSGAMIMASANDLIVIFVGLEILSIALYILAGYHRRRAESGEAAMKYFVLGAFSSAIFLYGIALVYGATGSTRLDEIAGFLARTHLTNGILLAGVILILVGLGFKVAAVPFHTWTPDVYQGSPSPVTGFMAAVAKAAGFAALIRILFSAFPTLADDWRPVVWVLAVLTLLVGAVLAVVQNDVKRMLAYSSINHAGYVLIGVQAASAKGRSGALFYLMAYAFLVLGSFAVVSVVGGRGEAHNSIESYRGLSSRRPGLALAFTVFLLGQAGVPFTTGFLAKFYVISAAVERGQYILAVIAMLAAAVTAFFYLRLTLVMYSPLPAAGAAPPPPAAASGGGGAVAVAAPPETGRITIPVGTAVALAVCLLFTIGIGLAPSPVIGFAQRATLLF